MKKPWTTILLVVNVGSLEKRSNRLKNEEQKSKKSEAYCKADIATCIAFLKTIFRLATPAFFRFTDVSEVMIELLLNIYLMENVATEIV